MSEARFEHGVKITVKLARRSVTKPYFYISI